MLEFYLYRAKFIKSEQISLFSQDILPSDIFIKAIKEKPSLSLNNNYDWHIGNVEVYQDGTGYFAVGRTKKSIVEKYDERSKNFLEKEDDESPHTHVLFDIKIGLLCIARKTKLAPTINGIARKIEVLFSNTVIVKEYSVDVKIDYIRDPKSFISHIKMAYAIKKFTATFTGPNPIDADEIFQKPMSVYLNKANGSSGRTTIKGRDLNSEVITEVAISVASTGNNANAQILENKDEELKIIYLGDNHINIKIDEEKFDKHDIIRQMVSKYKSVKKV
ncbi:MAG: hypothetical protein SCALA702_00020 [Melioribacteraceae bacterium]|nr:MAG: hypothetical protein SCALA702_00020 [Melioribacteraceae bacterium]